MVNFFKKIIYIHQMYKLRMYVSYTYAFEVHFDALRELSVVQNHSVIYFEHPFDAFGRLIYQFWRLCMNKAFLPLDFISPGKFRCCTFSLFWKINWSSGLHAYKIYPILVFFYLLEI
jgi:hypothetical protein